jgi:glycosyltransferase involved in cell wall biosynthesis
VWRARRALRSLLRRGKFDVVVCHQAWAHAIFGPVVKRARTALAVWVHMSQTSHWLERLAWFTQPDCIICNSRFTASTLPKTAVRVETIYPPVEKGAVPLFQEKGVRPLFPGVVIVQVSRMEAWKGQAVLLEALGAMRDCTDWTLLLVGGAQRRSEARYLESLRASARRLGISDRVRFLGQRTDVRDLLAAADIFCQPNLAPEPFGISFVEAMSAGLPVVTTAAGAALEIFDASSGALVPPGDINMLAATLRRLIQDPAERQRLGMAAASRAAELCDAATQTRRFATLMEELG